MHPKTPIRFTKMHALGNDFMVIDGINQNIALRPEDIQRLSERNTGIGFDQCLILEPSQEPDVDFFYRIYNADGSEVGQCGNGARCLARFIQHYQFSTKSSILVATHTTRMKLICHSDHSVTVEFAKPRLEPVEIPILVNNKQMYYSIPLDNETSYEVHAINVGNPHAILVVDQLDDAVIKRVGQAISEHALFPEQTNVGFMKILNPNRIALRVYERGCGVTQACGSGAVAATAVGILFHRLGNQVCVELMGGSVDVEWPTEKNSIFLTGVASLIYEGILLNA